MSNEKLLESFTSQGIEITRESFERLLKASNLRTLFRSYRAPLPLTADRNLLKLGRAEPAPLENWATVITKTLENIQKLKPGAARAEIAESLQEITEANLAAEDIIQRRLGRDL